MDEIDVDPTRKILDINLKTDLYKFARSHVGDKNNVKY